MTQPRAAYSDRQEKLYFKLLLAFVRGLFWLIINLYFRPMRVHHWNRGGYDKLEVDGVPRIWAGWHSDIYYCSRLVYGKGMVVMASRSNAGSVAAAMLEASGSLPVRGGSRKGGMEALAAVVDLIKGGRSASIIPDAPRGPACDSKIGPILAAQRSGAPLVPLGIAAQRRWVIEKSWDKAWIPKPFSPIHVVWRDPIWVGPELDREALEAKRQELTRIINEARAEAEARCGREWSGAPKAPSSGAS